MDLRYLRWCGGWSIVEGGKGVECRPLNFWNRRMGRSRAKMGVGTEGGNPSELVEMDAEIDPTYVDATYSI